MTPAAFLSELFEAAAGRPLRFGQLRIRQGEAQFSIWHEDDQMDEGQLRSLTNPSEIIEWASLDPQGDERMLRTAPTLKAGFFYRASDTQELADALDAFYPGVITTWLQYAEDGSEAVPLRQALIDQSADFPRAAEITDAMANEIMRETCSKGCLRTIAWPLSTESPVSKLRPARGEIPMICARGCSLAARHAEQLAAAG